MLKIFAWVSLLIFLQFSFAYSQNELNLFENETSLEEELLFSKNDLVVTGSRKPHKQIEAPGVIYIMNREEIEMSGATNFYELLQQIPGLDVFIRSNDFTDNTISIRGLIVQNTSPQNKILTMVNGRPIYGAIYGNTDWQTIPVNIEEIKRIEVVKGPGSALYGTNAFLGIINIITYEPDKDKITMINSGYGDSNQTWMKGLITKEIQNLKFGIAGGIDNHGGFSEEGKDEVYPDNFKKATLTTNLVYNLSRDWKLRLYSGILYGEGSTDAYGLGSREDGKALNYFFHLTNNWTFSEKTWFTLNAFINQDNSYFSDEVLKNLTSSDGKESTNSLSSTLTEVETSLSQILFGNHFLNASASFRGTIGEGFILRKDEDIHSNALGLSLVDEIELDKNFLLQLGVKLDKHSEIKPQMTYKTNAVYKASDNSVFRFGIGTAFRVPTVGERHFDLKNETKRKIEGDSLDYIFKVVSNLDLEPEKIRTIEIGYEGTFNRLNIKTDLYKNEISNLIDFQTINYEVFLNPQNQNDIEKVVVTQRSENNKNLDVIGFETELSYKFTNWFTAYVNYSFQALEEFIYADKDSQNQGISTQQNGDKILQGQRPLFVPKEKGNFGFRINYQDWKMHCWVRAVGQRKDVDDYDNDFLIDGLAHLNFVLEKKIIRDKVTVSFTGYRLLDFASDNISDVSRIDYFNGAKLGRDLRAKVSVNF
ncbi:TonB-dependent receptor [bacterium]|nr:TonB-dependent receptor [bacterium]